MGYEGFSELRFFLKNISERKTENQEEYISEKNDVNDIFEEMSHEINRTLMIQDREEIEEVVKKMAELKNMSYEDVVRITNENTRKAFKML